MVQHLQWELVGVRRVRDDVREREGAPLPAVELLDLGLDILAQVPRLLAGDLHAALWRERHPDYECRSSLEKQLVGTSYADLEHTHAHAVQLRGSSQVLVLQHRPVRCTEVVVQSVTVLSGSGSLPRRHTCADSVSDGAADRNHVRRTPRATGDLCGDL
eukprot:5762511-Pyramimonas_sp.AAC.1